MARITAEEVQTIPYGPLGIIALPGCEELAQKIDNYLVKYKMYGMDVPKSPDDHFADLKRVISAASSKAKRINVIMPMLYEGRQHKRSSRDSLDCAMALQELTTLGVENIITFDAHDQRVQNSIPHKSFENVMPTYQMIKALVNNVSDLHIDPDHLMAQCTDVSILQHSLALTSVCSTKDEIIQG